MPRFFDRVVEYRDAQTPVAVAQNVNQVAAARRRWCEARPGPSTGVSRTLDQFIQTQLRYRDVRRRLCRQDRKFWASCKGVLRQP